MVVVVGGTSPPILPRACAFPPSLVMFELCLSPLNESECQNSKTKTKTNENKTKQKLAMDRANKLSKERAVMMFYASL